MFSSLFSLSTAEVNKRVYIDKSYNLKTQKDKLKAQPGCVNCFC